MTTNNTTGHIAVDAAWLESADSLTSWALKHLAVRTDAYGRHTPVEKRGTPDRKGKPIGKNYTANRQLTENDVRRHFTATKAEDVIGLLMICLENTCLSVVLDIDHHGEPSPELEKRNEQFAVTKYQTLRQLGFEPLLTDSNGRGGFHLRIIFANPIPSQVAFAFGRWLAQGWQSAGLTSEPESFPKREDRHSPKGQGGGWVRLPGRHHTRDVWARVFDGETWHDGALAVEEILSHTGDDPALIPDDAKAVVPEQPANGKTAAKAKPSAREKLYADNLVHDGEGRRNAMYAEACAQWRERYSSRGREKCFDDLKVNERVLKTLSAFNDARCLPPIESDELRQQCDHARDFIRVSVTKPWTPGPVEPDVSEDVSGDAWTNIKAEQGRTELANARRFVAAFGNDVLFCHAWGKWLAWDGARWKIDDDGAVTRMATTVADQVWHEAVDHRTDDTIEFAEKTSKASGINAMLKLAASMRPIRVDDLDANPMLLNCPNGTLHLRTGELRPHRREDTITKISPTNFKPDAGSFHFDRFLEGLFPDQSTIDFMQRFFGYCLTGDVSEQILAVFYGIGSNGKSTLLNAIQHTLGTDFSAAAPPSLLMEKKTETHPTELAGLFGKRLVIAQETNAGARLAEATVKSLTGGDVISARRMREDFWQFSPTHKLVLVTNHKPRVKGTDHAIWRRLVLVPFARKFWNPDKGETGPAELRQNKALPAKLKLEAEGCLTWMVQGCLSWQRTGLQIPESVRAATEVYRNESDTLGRFVAECCLTMPSVKVKFSCLFDELEKWCNEGGDNLPTRTFAGQWLKDNGYQDKHSGARWYLGIALKAETTV